MSAFIWGRNAVSASPVAFSGAKPLSLPSFSGAAPQAKDVSVGQAHVCVLTSEGTILSACSDPQHAAHTGVLGRKKGAAGEFHPVAFETSEPFVAVASGSNHNLAISASGELWEWGNLFKAQDTSTSGRGRAGNNAGGGGGGDRTVLSHELPGLSERMGRNEYLRRVVATSEAAYLASVDISRITTGPVNATASASVLSASPSAAPGTPVISAGPSITTTITAAGSAGAAAEAPTTSAEEVLRIQVIREVISAPRIAAGLVDASGRKIRVVAASCGFAHSLVLTEDGTVLAAGYNERGMLGTGNRLPSASFKPVAQPLGSGSSSPIFFTGIAAGQQHSLASDREGRVWSWGGGVLGQLGLGHSGGTLVPTRVNIKRPDEESGDEAASSLPVFVTAVASGANHSLALTSEGEVFAWGHSEYAQMGESGGAASDLGKGSRYFYVPRRVDGFRWAKERTSTSSDSDPLTVVSIAAGGQFNLAVLSDGSAVSFGWDAFGCLGRGGDSQEVGAASGVAGAGAIAAAAAATHRAHAMNAKRHQTFGRVSGLHGLKVVKAVCGPDFTAAAITQSDGHAFSSEWLKLLAAADVNKGNALLEAVAAERRRRRVSSGADKGKAEEESTVAVGGASAAASAAFFRGPVAGGEDSSAAYEPSKEIDEDDDDVAFARAADVLLIPTAAAPPSAHPAAAAVQRAEKNTESIDSSKTEKSKKAVSQLVLERQKALEALLPATLSAPPAKKESTAEAKAEGTPTTAALAAQFAPVGAHSAVLFHRLPSHLRKAMLEAKRTPGANINVPLTSPGCVPITVRCVAFEGDCKPRLEIVFPSHSRRDNVSSHTVVNTQVLSGLAAFLYSDRLLPSFPPFRLGALRSLATALGLERLAFLARSDSRGALSSAADDDAFDELFLPLAVSPPPTAGSSKAAAPILDASASSTGRAALTKVPPSTFVEDLSRAYLAAAPRVLASTAEPEELGFADILLTASSSEGEGKEGGIIDGEKSEVTFAAHRLILSRSAFFRKLIRGLSGSDGGGGATVVQRHTLKGVSPAAFNSVLRFLYSGDISTLEKPGDDEGTPGGRDAGATDASGNLAFDVLILADRFMLGELASRLTSLLASRVKDEDLSLLVEMAREHGLAGLEKVAASRLLAASSSSSEGAAAVLR